MLPAITTTEILVLPLLAFWVAFIDFLYALKHYAYPYATATTKGFSHYKSHALRKSPILGTHC